MPKVSPLVEDGWFRLIIRQADTQILRLLFWLSYSHKFRQWVSDPVFPIPRSVDDKYLDAWSYLRSVTDTHGKMSFSPHLSTISLVRDL